MLRAGAAAAVPAVAPLMAGCGTLAAPMTAALRAQPPAGLARRVDLTVPFQAQDDKLCGPATLAMLLRAAGLPADMATLTEQVYLPGREGSLQIEMLAATRRHGALAFTLPPKMSAVAEQLASGTPVALLLNLALSFWPRWHYAVWTGYDLDSGRAWLHSGTTAHEEWSLETLEHTWVRGGAWALVALPPGQWPLHADAAGATAAVAAFERSQSTGSAAVGKAWRSAHERWPEEIGPALGLGNHALANGDPTQAAAVFDAAAKRHDSAVVWNNLAVARARMGQRDAARAALDHAEQRARIAEPRWLDEVLATRRELGL